MIDTSPLLHLTLSPALAIALLLLAIMAAAGCLLAPARLPGDPPLLRLSVILTSGMLFVSGIAACWCVGRWCYLAVIPLAQIMAVLLWRKARTEPAAALPGGQPMPLKQAALLAAIIAAFAALFSLPCMCVLPDGRIREMHEDLGFFVQQVMGIPEAGAASIWSAALGGQAAAAGQHGDMWYHWGSVFIAAAARAMTGMTAITALLGVSRTVMDVVLLAAAGAVVESLLRLPPARSLIIGGLSLFSVQLLKNTALLDWMAGRLPWGDLQHIRTTLAMLLSYKFEGAVLLCSIALWQSRKTTAAGLMLFLAAASSPQVVASLGTAAAGMIAAGLAMRNARLWKTAAAIAAIVAAAWAAVLLCGAEMAKAQGQSIFSFAPGELVANLGRGAADAGIGLMVSALSLPGVLHLIRSRDGQAGGDQRSLGWLALCGMIFSFFAFHFLKGTADRFHVVMFTQVALVMPAGFWGACRMALQDQLRWRLAGMSAAAAMAAMGLHDLVLPLAGRGTAVWSIEDIAAVKHELRGRPFGYFASADRGWWIPKHAVLGSLLDSRCIRLNPADDRREPSRYYGWTAPFALVPPAEKETSGSWSLRLACKLGIRHVIETWQDRLPKSLKNRSRLVASGRGLSLYELPDDSSPITAAPLQAPAAQANSR